MLIFIAQGIGYVILAPSVMRLAFYKLSTCDLWLVRDLYENIDLALKLK